MLCSKWSVLSSLTFGQTQSYESHFSVCNQISFPVETSLETESGGGTPYWKLHPRCQYNIHTFNNVSIRRMGWKISINRQNVTILLLSEQLIHCSEAIQCIVEMSLRAKLEECIVTEFSKGHTGNVDLAKHI